MTVLLLAAALLPPVAARELQVPDPYAQPTAPPTPPRVIIVPNGLLMAPPAGANAAPPAPAELVAKARAGDVDAQVKLGIAYMQTKPPNFQEALKWYRQASDAGNAPAATNIGELYAAGLGVARNPTEAAKWYRLAAERGFGAAQAKLAHIYETGLGVPQDYAEALKWYRAAADQNNAAGQNGLGGMYANAHGVTADQFEATRLFHLAANQGLALAQANLGTQYLAGRGTGQNNTAGYFWLNLAVARLPPAMSAMRDQIVRAHDAAAAKLAPPELARVQHMAGAWQPGSADVPAN